MWNRLAREEFRLRGEKRLVLLIEIIELCEGVNTESILKVSFISTSTYYKLNPSPANWGPLVIPLNLV